MNEDGKQIKVSKSKIRGETKMGRNPIHIDMQQLGALCRLKPTLEDVAAFFKCNPLTIERRIKEEMGLTFVEFRAQNFVHTRYDLVRKAMRMAETNPTMMIFCLKNMANWTDKTETELSFKTPNEAIAEYLEKHGANRWKD